MLASAADHAFDDNEWLFEIKWDGYRAVAEVTENDIRFYSRNGNDFSKNFPLIAEALKKIKIPCVLDGELVVLNKKGVPDFQKIQQYEINGSSPLVYYVFDLLSLNNQSLMELPLLERKKLLKQLVGNNKQIRFSDHVLGKGEAFFKLAIKKDLEGILAKKTDSNYYSGKRTKDWLKIKSHKTADVVIAGFTDPGGSRKNFGSLVLGIMDGKEIKHVGQAGTGYNDESLSDLYSVLQPIIQKQPVFKVAIKTKESVTWVKPILIAEVKFTEWTNDGKLRHPVFIRLRPDKLLNETEMKNNVPVKIDDEEKSGSDELRIGSAVVKITNREKLYWPEEKISKGMLIDYYQEIASDILPFLKGRPESLKRNPNGILDKGFFHKDAGEKVPGFVQAFQVHSESSNKQIDYIVCNNKATLAYLNNLGCIELNPWHSTTKTPDNPDYLIIDIDPSEKNNFNQVIEVALAFKEVLDIAGAKSFCKTSGATGMHIYLPMGKEHNYEEVKNFAQLLCMIVGNKLPEITTLERNLKKRGNKKIYLDYLQNRSGQTIAAVYSVRPVKGATVSMPLEWDDVKPGLLPGNFTIHNATKIIKEHPGIFKGVLGKAVNMEKCLKKLQQQYGAMAPD